MRGGGEPRGVDMDESLQSGEGSSPMFSTGRWEEGSEDGAEGAELGALGAAAALPESVID